MTRTTDLSSYGGDLNPETVDRIDRAAQMRAAMGDVEFMLLEMGLQVDAAYVADLMKTGEHDAATDYIRTSNYVERMNAWKRAKR